MDWKDKRIKEINNEISETKKKYNFDLKDYYVDEYYALKISKAKSYEDFKKERGIIWVVLIFIFQ